MFNADAFALRLARLSDDEFMRYLEELPPDSCHLDARDTLLLGEAVRLIFEPFGLGYKSLAKTPSVSASGGKSQCANAGLKQGR